MKTLRTLALKVLGFFTFIYVVFRLGKAEAKLKQAENRANEAQEESKRIIENNAIPYVDDPALCLYDISEDSAKSDIPETDKKTGP